MTILVSNDAAVRESAPTHVLTLCRTDVEWEPEEAVEREFDVPDGVPDGVAEQARAFGDNLAALYPFMSLSALGEISDALGVPLSQLISLDFDAASVPRPPALWVVKD